MKNRVKPRVELLERLAHYRDCGYYGIYYSMEISAWSGNEQLPLGAILAATEAAGESDLSEWNGYEFVPEDFSKISWWLKEKDMEIGPDAVNFSLVLSDAEESEECRCVFEKDVEDFIDRRPLEIQRREQEVYGICYDDIDILKEDIGEGRKVSWQEAVEMVGDSLGVSKSAAEVVVCRYMNDMIDSRKESHGGAPDDYFKWEHREQDAWRMFAKAEEMLSEASKDKRLSMSEACDLLVKELRVSPEAARVGARNFLLRA